MAYSKIDTLDYTLGKGKVYFQLGDTFDGKYEHLGNAPEVSLTLAIEKLEHFSSRAGAKQKDKEVVTQKKASGKFALDDPNLNNLKRWLFASTITEAVQTVQAAATNNTFVAAHDVYKAIGAAGAFVYSATNLVVKDATDTTTYVLDTDYNFDPIAGLLRILSTGAIADAATLHLTFDRPAKNTHSVDGLVNSSLKGFFLFVGDPPTGKKQMIEGYCSITPEGDAAMIGDDWQKLSFTVEFTLHSKYTPAIVKFSDLGAAA